jgi:hypothetical protein
VNSPQLSEGPVKPGWFRTAPIEGDSQRWSEERNSIAKNFDLKKHHVFWGLNPHDEAQPPPGWLERQREDFEKQCLQTMSEEDARTLLERVNLTFDYAPIRVFAVPHAETSEIIRTFRVGTHHHMGEEVMNATSARVEAIDQIVPIGVVHADDAGVTLVFLEPASPEQCQKIEELFPFLEEGDMELGLEDYLSDWDPDAGSGILAERFHQDQEIRLWWD